MIIIKGKSAQSHGCGMEIGSYFHAPPPVSLCLLVFLKQSWPRYLNSSQGKEMATGKLCSTSFFLFLVSIHTFSYNSLVDRNRTQLEAARKTETMEQWLQTLEESTQECVRSCGWCSLCCSQTPTRRCDKMPTHTTPKTYNLQKQVIPGFDSQAVFSEALV